MAQVKLTGAISETNNMDSFGVFGGVEGVLENFRCLATRVLFELVSALEKDRPLLYLVYLTLEKDLVV